MMKRNYQNPYATVIDLSETDLIRTSGIPATPSSWDAAKKENYVSANQGWFEKPKS